MRALLLLLVFLSGCYVCSPETCADGCCSASGTCIVAPVDDDACGLGGGACVDCRASGQACQRSVCVARCTPANCNGCCAGTQCVAVSAQTSQRCGTGGETCQVCLRSCGPSGVCQ